MVVEINKKVASDLKDLSEKVWLYTIAARCLILVKMVWHYASFHPVTSYKSYTWPMFASHCLCSCESTNMQLAESKRHRHGKSFAFMWCHYRSLGNLDSCLDITRSEMLLFDINCKSTHIACQKISKKQKKGKSTQTNMYTKIILFLGFLSIVR